MDFPAFRFVQKNEKKTNRSFEMEVGLANACNCFCIMAGSFMEDWISLREI